jgi:hypothetical protein
MKSTHHQPSQNYNRSTPTSSSASKGMVQAMTEQSSVHHLQRLIGNQAVGQLIKAHQKQVKPARPPQPVIQRKLSPEGLEIAKQWERDVLNEATLSNSTERNSIIEQLKKIALDEQLDPRKSDTQFLNFLSTYQLPEPDEDAIFEDAVPGVIAVERITSKHRELLILLKNQLIDGFVEENLKKSQQEIDEQGPSAAAIASVKSGTFTSVKDKTGAWDPSLNAENREGILDRAEEFTEFTGMEPPVQLPDELWISLYRRVKGVHLQSLKKGDTITEMLPFSTSFERGFAEEWSPTEGVIFEIQVPVNYPAMFQARRPGAEKPIDGPEPLNEEQSEVTLVQSELKLMEAPRVELDSKGNNNFIVKVSAKPISLDTALKQHRVSGHLKDENRRVVAAQQRDEDPEEPTEFQDILAGILGPFHAQLEELYPKVKVASSGQIKSIKERLLKVVSMNIFEGPAADILSSVSSLDEGDGVVLKTILQRFFDPQYHRVPPNQLRIKNIEQLSGLFNVIVGEVRKFLQ